MSNDKGAATFHPTPWEQARRNINDNVAKMARRTHRNVIAINAVSDAKLVLGQTNLDSVARVGVALAILERAQTRLEGLRDD